MESVLVGLGGVALAGGVATLFWLRRGAAARDARRLARRVQHDLRALGLEEPFERHAR